MVVINVHDHHFVQHLIRPSIKFLDTGMGVVAVVVVVVLADAKLVQHVN